MTDYQHYLCFWVILLSCYCTSQTDEIILSDLFSNNSQWTVVKPVDGYQVNFGSGGKVRFRNSGTLGTTEQERFVYFYNSSPLVVTRSYNPVYNLSQTGCLNWYFTLGDSFIALNGNDYNGNATDGGKDVGGWIIGASDSDIYNNGVGYGVSLAQGETATDNGLTFFRYSGGLKGTVTELIKWVDADGSVSSLGDVNSFQTAIHLSYKPRNNLWTLSGNNAGGSGFATAFADARTVSYDRSDTKSIVDATHTTTALPYLAFFLSTDEGVPQFYCDNLYLTTSPNGAVLIIR